MPLQKIEFMYDITEGYRFVKFGIPRRNEHYLVNGELRKSDGHKTCDYPIVEKITEQERPPQPELKLQYKTQRGDWRDVDDGYEYRIKPKTRIVRFRNWLSKDGNVYAATEDIAKDLKWLGDWQEVEIEENE